MDATIQVENLSKAYQLGQFNTGSLAYDLKRWWALKRGKEDPFLKIGETNDRTLKGSSNVVWSLQNLNFSIQQGETVGIIGRNGAGKSTLLKLLSNITAPTSGKIKINGRIASLLEVGTGFHPELTGRENIFLNGAILGMRKQEIKRKFDEIVDFSGVERYIDTPVKRYSSGMYVRLAFAVAAHLESEILIVDEVLAVGDAEFQKKCLGKMNDISGKDARTILFVSHNLEAINTLCNRGLLLENGELTYNGHIKDTISKYLSKKDYGIFNENSEIKDYVKRRGTGTCRFRSIKIKNSSGKETFEFNTHDSIEIEFEVICYSFTDKLIVSIAVFSNMSNEIISNTDYFKISGENFEAGQVVSFKIVLEDFILNAGEYPLYFWIGNNLIDSNPFDVVDKALPNLIIKKAAFKNYQGIVDLKSKIIQPEYL